MTIDATDVNLPEVLAELHELYPRYEQALVTNDVETLRKARPANNLARTVKRLDIVSFGRDYASITLEFERERVKGQLGNLIHGRQSQVWVRFSVGWRIVSAHVSLLSHP
jgi:hypothetical protein